MNALAMTFENAEVFAGQKVNGRRPSVANKRRVGSDAHFCPMLGVAGRAGLKVRDC